MSRDEALARLPLDEAALDRIMAKGYDPYPGNYLFEALDARDLETQARTAIALAAEVATLRKDGRALDAVVQRAERAEQDAAIARSMIASAEARAAEARTWGYPLKQALAAREADCAELREALGDCVTVMDEHADATLGACKHPSRTRTKSCRERAHKALATPHDATALRAFGERVAVATLSKWHVQPDRMFADEAAAIVTRILPPATGEGK